MTRKTILLVVFAAALALRLAHFGFISATAFPKFPEFVVNSDMAATWEWARTILAGDALGRDTYHPYFEWMKAIAPLETWYGWWGGKEIFQQSPLYPYVVAALARASNRSLSFILLAQLLIGSAGVVLIYTLGKRLFGAPVGLVAAALAALFGPFVFYEGTLLRDWLPPLVEPAALVLLLRARERDRWIDYGAAGALFGVAILARESAVLLLPAALIWIFRAAPRSARAAAALAAGALLALSPLVARNLIVGAPALAISNRAAETLIEAHGADEPALGHQPSARLQEIMDKTGGRLPPVMAEIVRSYRGDVLLALARCGEKLRGIFGPDDIPDNLSYDYGATISPALRFFTLPFGWIVPFALAGVVLARRNALLALYALSTLTTLLLLPIVGRYRLALAPALIVYAAFALAWLYQAWKQKHPRLLEWLFGIAAAAVFEFVFVSPVLPPELRPLHAGNEYVEFARVYGNERRFDRAVEEFDKLEAAARQDPEYEIVVHNARKWRGVMYGLWADWLEANGQTEEAARMRKRFVPVPDAG